MPTKKETGSTPRRLKKAAGRAPAGRTVLARIAKGEFQPVYVLVGPDLDASDAIIAELRKGALGPGLEPFDFDSLDADECRADDFQQRLLQLPVGPRRLVVIRNITRPGSDRDKVVFSGLQKKGTEELCRLVLRAPDTTIVALTAAATNELSPILQAAGLAGFTVDLSLPEQDELKTLVHSWARERNFELAPDAVRMLLEVSGDDTTTLKNEVEKLATAVEPGTEVGPAMVRDIAGSSRAFDLADYVRLALSRESGAAMSILRRLEQSGEKAPFIVAWLTNAFLDLVLLGAGRDSWYTRNRLAGAEKLWTSESELNLMLQQLYRVQKAMLEGKQEVFAGLELLTYCIGCAPGKSACGLHRDDRYWQSCPRSTPKRVK